MHHSEQLLLLYIIELPFMECTLIDTGVNISIWLTEICPMTLYSLTCMRAI